MTAGAYSISSPARDSQVADRVALAGVLIALAVLPLAYDRTARDPFTTPKRVAFGIAVTGLLTVAWSARMRAGIRTNRAHACLVAFFAAAVVSAAGASSGILAIEGLRDLALLALPAAALGVAVVRSPRRVLLCAHALGVAGLLAALVGILQHQRIDWWGWRPTLDDARAPGALPSPDLVSWPVAGWILRGLYAALDGLSRVTPGWLPSRLFARLPTIDGAASVFGHPNVAAEVVAAGLAGLAVATRAGWGRGPGRVLITAARVSAMAVMAFYLVLTGTRGAWVALAATGLLLTAAYIVQAPAGRRARRVVNLLVFALVLGAAGWAAASRITVPGRGGGPPETAFDRLATLVRPADPARDTVFERKVLWANTHGMLAGARPGEDGPSYFGVGPSNWQVEYPLHHRDELKHPVGTYTMHRYADHAHQDPLEMLAEHGVVGAAALAAFLGAAIARLLARTRGGSREARHAALALLAVLAALGTVSLFSFPLHLGPPLVILFLLAGAALAPWGGVADRPAGPLAVAVSGALYAGACALGGAGKGAAIALAVGLAGAAALRARPARAPVVAGVAAAACALGLLAAGSLESALGALDAAVATVAAGLVALTSLPLDRPGVASPAASRSLTIAAVAACVLALLGGAARLDASEGLQSAWDQAFGARMIPGERRAATERARDAYDLATAANPADFFGEVARADFLGRIGFTADAEASVRRTLRIHPWLSLARMELAALRRAQGDDPAAMREAILARSLNPDAVEPHLLISELFLREGRDQLAAQELERAIELAPKRVLPRAKVRASEIYFTAGQELSRALRHLEEAEREAPDDPEILGRIAAVYAAPGAPPGFNAKAERLWQRVLALDPADAQARLRISVAPLLTKEPEREEVERILASLDALMRSDPEFEPARVRYYRALALEKLGRRAEAERALREVTLLLAVGPLRGRTDDRHLDEAIRALRDMQESRPASRR